MKKRVAVCNITFHDVDKYLLFKESAKSKNYELVHYWHDNTENNLGYSRGQNICIEQGYAAGADYFLVSNADVELSENFIDDIIPLLDKNPNFLALSGCRRDEVNKQLYEVTKDPIYLSDVPQRGVNYDGDWSAFVFPRRAIQILKESDERAVKEGRMTRPVKGIFFDEEQKVLYWEDNLKKLDIYTAGFKQGKVNNIVFDHIVGYTTKIGKAENANYNFLRNRQIYMDIFKLTETENEPWRGDKMPHKDFNW